jgi:hypothetical protein
MSVDTNKLDILSDCNSNSYTINISVNSYNSSFFEEYVNSLPTIGRKNIVKLAVTDQKKAVICFNTERLSDILDQNSDSIDVHVFHPYNNKYISSLNSRNLTIIAQQTIADTAIRNFSDKFSSTNSSNKLIKDEIIKPIIHSENMIYSLSPSHIGDYENIISPEPFCDYYSNPLAGHFSPHYAYANKANTPCCSNPQLTKNSDTVFICSFSCHSQCSFYAPQKYVLESVNAVDSVASNENILFQLIKSRYTDSTIRYSITNNDVVSFNQVHAIDSILTEEEIDNEMKKLFHITVDQFSHSKTPAPVSVAVSEKRSFISNIIK